MTDNGTSERAAFLLNVSRTWADDKHLRDALETMTADEVREVAALAHNLYHVSSDVWAELVTYKAIRVLPPPRNI